MAVDDTSLWNLKIIDPPPFVTLDYSQKEFNDIFKSTNFSVLFKSHLEKLRFLLKTGENLFLSEKEILEKLIFKNWNSLRKEKSLQYMKKLKRLLNDYVGLKFYNLIDSINVMSQSLENSVKKKPKISLPSREVFEYFLTRLYSIIKIFHHIIFIIRNKIYLYIIKNIKNAIFLSNNLLYLSNTARIYCLVKKYQVNTKFLYINLRENVCLIKSTGVKWSESFNIDELPLAISEDHAEIQNKILDKCMMDFENITAFRFLSNDQDIGEVIDRDTIEKKSNPKYKKKKKQPCSSKRNILFKKILLFVTSLDQIDKIKSKFKRFVKSKLKKLGSDYSNFLKDCLEDKKVFIKKLNEQLKNVANMNLDKKSQIRKSIVQVIRRLIK